MIEARDEVALGEDTDQRAGFFDEHRAAALRLHRVDDLEHRVTDVDGRERTRRQVRDLRDHERAHAATHLGAQRHHPPPPRSTMLITSEMSLCGGVARGVASISSNTASRCRITSHTVSTPRIAPA